MIGSASQVLWSRLVMKFCTVYGLQRMNSTGFSGPLAFHPVATPAQNLSLSSKIFQTLSTVLCVNPFVGIHSWFPDNVSRLLFCVICPIC